MACLAPLTHWGRVTHICVGKLTIIDSDNGLSPGRRQAIIWTNAGIVLIGPLGTNSSQIVIGIQTFSFKKMHLKVSSAKWRPFCLGFNVLSNAELLSAGSSGTNFNEYLIEIQLFSMRKMRLKMSSATRRRFYLGLHVLTSAGPMQSWVIKQNCHRKS